MPYLTKFEREQLEWISLADAVQYVASVEGYPTDPRKVETSPGPLDPSDMPWLLEWPEHPADMSSALGQILNALGDGEIPANWTLTRLTLPKPGSMFEVEPPPQGGLFWAFVDVFIYDNYAISGNPLRLIGGIVSEHDYDKRQLWLLRSRVLELWPKRNDPRLGEESIKSRMKGTPLSSEQYKQLAREEARKLYENGGPNIVVAEQSIRTTAYIPRKILRDVLNEPEFQVHRRKPGNNRPRKSR